MTELLPELSERRTTRRLDPPSAQLQLVSAVTGRDALLESCDGVGLRHQLPVHEVPRRTRALP
jgi:hypothetical protein